MSVVVNFLPSYLFTALSNFSWVCWIAPNNCVVNRLFGVTHGMAMGVLTFNWGQISFHGSPHFPRCVAANGGFTIVIFYWIISPILCVRYFLFSCSAAAFSLFYGSARTSGTRLAFHWCRHTPSITLAKHTMFPELSTMASRSTSWLTMLRALCSFLFLHRHMRIRICVYHRHTAHPHIPLLPQRGLYLCLSFTLGTI